MSHQKRTEEHSVKKSFARNYLKDIVIVSIGIVVIFVGFKIALGTGNLFYVVSSGSMMPTIDVYDVIVVQENIPFDHIKVGDIVAFKSPGANSELIVHRVAQILNQNPFEIRTKGDANLESISGIDLPITKDNFIGKIVYVIPHAGYLTGILTPPMNYIIIASIIGIIAVKPFYSQK